MIKRGDRIKIVDKDHPRVGEEYFVFVVSDPPRWIYVTNKMCVKPEIEDGQFWMWIHADKVEVIGCELP